MARLWPRIEYKEEALREGMQIEDAGISVEDKVRLIDALSDTGLREIVVGSFVRPEYTPQMAHIEAVIQGFHPRPGVKYTALLVNQRAVERAQRYVPPLTIERTRVWLSGHMCDVFCRRNYNRSQAEVEAGWSKSVVEAQEAGITEAGIGVHAAWGSNFTGEADIEEVMAMLERAHALWDAAGIPVRSVMLGDPLSWNTPYRTEVLLQRIKSRWPDINGFWLHLHNARGMAIVSAYAAMSVLDALDTLHIDGSIGGIGGCPYCGNGRATGMIATEDFFHMLDGLEIAHGVDLDRLVDCVWLLENVLGRPVDGHVSKAGPRPTTPDKWYDPNMPFVEAFTEARHFKLGPGVYQSQIHPWKTPIKSSQRPDTLGLPS